MDENGHVYFLDRFKHAIRRRGENISSFELERIIIQHESVRECCAVGVPSPVGEQDIKIVVVPDSGVEIDPQELRAWCFERMAHFMVPRYIELRDRLPRGPTGKVQKEGLGSVSAEVYDAEAVPTT
jgi:crotonobetaine/carnitine-CoA ligase